MRGLGWSQTQIPSAHIPRATAVCTQSSKYFPAVRSGPHRHPSSEPQRASQKGVWASCQEAQLPKSLCKQGQTTPACASTKGTDPSRGKSKPRHHHSHKQQQHQTTTTKQGGGGGGERKLGIDHQALGHSQQPRSRSCDLWTPAGACARAGPLLQAAGGATLAWLSHTWTKPGSPKRLRADLGGSLPEGDC